MSNFHFADSNRARLRVIKEADNAWGSTPATGVSRELRYKGSTINATKTTVVSDEIRADRMVEDQIETGAKTGGDVQVEFSAGSHDDFMESFMYGAWTRPMTFDLAEGVILEFANASTLYIKGVDKTDYFFAGRRIVTSGFAVPANNDYFEIQAIVFNAAANRTEMTLTAATAVAERGSAYSVVYDANDVIVLKNTHIRAGTAGEDCFDSNGANAFAGAIAAGHLAVGQKVFVEGLGFEVGSVEFVGQPNAGSKLTISDNDKTVVYQFGGAYTQQVVAVDLGTDAAATAEAFFLAINKSRVRSDLAVSATIAGAVVTLKNLHVVDGSIIKTSDTAAAMTVTAFAGGEASLRGVFKIETLTDDKLNVSPSPATFANAGALAVTIKGSMLRNPHIADEIIPQSFSIETGFEDVGQYFIADGLRVGTMAYTISSGAILDGTYGFSGRGTKRQGVTKLGADPYTVLDTTDTSIANATTNVGQIKINGEAMSTAVQSISLSGNNTLRDQMAVGNKFPVGIGAGRMEITGNLTAYFADGSLWDMFIEHAVASVEFSVEDVEGHHYEFTIPSAHFSTDTVNPAAGNQDVLETMEYQAKRDPVTNCQIQLDRFSPVHPTAA